MKHSIKNKIRSVIIKFAVVIIITVGFFTIFSLLNIRQNASDNLNILDNDATLSATNALNAQMQERILALANNKSELANSAIEMMYHQTRLVAIAAKSVYSNEAKYIGDTDISELPVNQYDFSCNLPDGTYGTYSQHMRAPRYVMNADSIVEEDGKIVKATLDETKLSRIMRKDLYLAGYLNTALDGLKNYDNGDGTYNGIGASYFCIASSGIDVLADTLTQPMVEYDARKYTWYKEASKLDEGEVYWTHPVPDASGRGLSLICAMPVYVNGRIVGIAGSGGAIDNIKNLIQSTTIGSDGYAFMVNTANPDGMNVLINANEDEACEINMHKDNLFKTDSKELRSIFNDIKNMQSGISEAVIDGRSSYIAYSPLKINSWAIVIVLPIEDDSLKKPVDELGVNLESNTQNTIEHINSNIWQIILVFIVYVVIVSLSSVVLSNRFAGQLTRPIKNLTEGAKMVSGGDFDTKLNVDTGDELQILGESFNFMTESIKDYIENLSRVTKEKERIGAELDVARSIQASALPRKFPPFPERHEFEIYATMEPAKEVGGDFYDFFFIDSNHLALVMADVSGKGVPAALFMMISKMLIKSTAQKMLSPAGIFENVNNQLCENNDAQMFVTMWMGILDVTTGVMMCANAGHEYPAIKKADGQFELFKDKHGFVLAGMENVKYKEYEIMLCPGDKIFVYTDGVAEATNAENELYGTDRMLNALNSFGKDMHENASSAGEEQIEECRSIIDYVRQDVDKFVDEAPQFDDITMLCLTYFGA